MPEKKRTPSNKPVVKNSVPGITSFEDLKRYAKGNVVTLPPFAEGQPFVARMKRPSLMELVRNGEIPNELLTRANALFFDSTKAVEYEDEATMKQIFEIIDSICKASFVEPTYEEIVDSGVKLTDEQLMFVFQYSQKGVQALGSFRGK